MRLLIYTQEPFPVGFAGTNRILSYCYGLIKNGVSVFVISTSPKSTCMQNAEPIFKNLKHLQLIALPFFRSKITIFLHKIAVLIVYPVILRSLIRGYHYDAIILYGYQLLLEDYVLAISRKYGIPVLKEVSEYPCLKLSRKISRFSDNEKSAFMLKMHDRYSGILAMTQPLYDYFSDIGIKEEKIRLIPQTVVGERMELRTVEEHLISGDYILFSGSLSDSKDGIISLINAFRIVHEVINDIGLVVVGFGSRDEIVRVKNEIKANKLEESTRLILNLSNARVPALLRCAKLLVSPRPYSVQALYGFPTKVAEYLSTGNPVLTTSYGDLSLYLKDGINAYILDSSDSDCIAKQIINALMNYDKALIFGKSGKKLAKEYFDPVINTQKIINFINDLKL